MNQFFRTCNFLTAGLLIVLLIVLVWNSFSDEHGDKFLAVFVGSLIAAAFFGAEIFLLLYVRSRTIQNNTRIYILQIFAMTVLVCFLFIIWGFILTRQSIVMGEMEFRQLAFILLSMLILAYSILSIIYFGNKLRIKK